MNASLLVNQDIGPRGTNPRGVVAPTAHVLALPITKYSERDANTKKNREQRVFSRKRENLEFQKLRRATTVWDSEEMKGENK